MILQVFTALTKALQGNSLLALGASLTWGVLSILLSPCHLASIPLIVGFVSGQGKVTVKRAFWISLLFSTGILLTIVLIGIITGMLGRLLGDIGKWGNYFVATVFFVVGLYLLGIINIPLPVADTTRFKNTGLWAAFALGLIFGIALGPCTFAYMAPILGLVFSMAAERFPYAVALILAYAVGHTAVIVLAGTFTELVESYLHWNEKSRGFRIIKKLCAVLILAAGIYLILQK